MQMPELPAFVFCGASPIRGGDTTTVEEEEEEDPTNNSGMQNGKLSQNMYALRTLFFCAFRAADLHAQSVLINKNFCIDAQVEVC